MKLNCRTLLYNATHSSILPIVAFCNFFIFLFNTFVLAALVFYESFDL